MIQQYLSVGLFVLFAACVAVRAASLRRRGIRAIVFGETDKSDFVLIPVVLTVVYAVCANAFGLWMWEPLMFPFWESTLPGWIGIALGSLAIIGMIATLISFGDSFRVGIDEKQPDKLITAGMFALSRNPIYVCFDAFFLGQFLVHRNAITLLAVIGFALLIHRQILREEEFLKSHYAAEYEEYCNKTRRYL